MSIKSIVFLIKNDSLILPVGIVFFGNALAGFFNLFYHLISVRILTVEDYGTLNALISFAMLSLVVIPSLCMSITRYFTECIAKNNLSILVAALFKIMKRIFVAAFLIFLLFFFTSSLLAGFFKTQAVFINICAIVIALSLFSSPLLSVFQSFQKFEIYTIVWVVSSLAKLILATILMLLGWRILGGLLGFLVGSVVFFWISLYFLPTVLPSMRVSAAKKSVSTVNLAPIYRCFFPSFSMLLAFAILTNIDVILVKHFFQPIDAGYYSIAQMVGKIALFLPSAIAIVIFPKCTTSFVHNKSSLKILYKSLFLGGICCFVITVLSFLFPDVIIRILTGEVSHISSRLVGLFSLAMSFYALLWIIINFTLATYNLKLIIPLLLMAVFEAVFIYSYHPTLAAILYTLLGFAVISFSVTLFVVKATDSLTLKSGLYCECKKK